MGMRAFLICTAVLALLCEATRPTGCYCQPKFADKRTRFGYRCKIHPSDTEFVGSFVPHEPWDPSHDFGINGWYKGPKGGVWSVNNKWRCTPDLDLVPTMKFTLDKTNWVSMSRGMCFGTCPVYTLKIYGDGSVEYNGQNFVKVKGAKTATIATSKVEELFTAFAAAKFDELPNYERRMVTDMPSAQVTSNLGGVKHIVNHYMGDDRAPKDLFALEDLMDRVVNVEQWTGKKPTQIQKFDITTAEITMTRTEDFWKNWPAYTVIIKGDGTVTFQGSFNGQGGKADVVKSATSTLSVEKVRDLVMTVLSVDFWDAKSFPYDKNSLTDQASASLKLKLDGKENTINHYFGNKAAPQSYYYVERTIDMIVDTCQWLGSPRTMWWC
eukprot:NODE_117_length_1487_cov_522.275000_g115_i0.p1 GENE.NODE_117_length_1487_cov_522.275000_g115_i0~~NODE_117_length_1487_cov_522.275000_g115_i0.p1  ORF type:complete len:382 (-),score=85.45 NODE_117_length_1487_cov_522.275000_g115_i0:288-1433(-)